MFALLLGLLLALSLAFTGDADADPVDPLEPDEPTEGDDSLTGSAGPDLIDGLGGDDTIDGAEGDDTLLGSEGNDWLTGGEGRDSVSGGEGNDRLDLGEGIDTLEGGAGDDTLTLQDGFDSAFLYDDDGNLIGIDRPMLDGGDGDETEGDLMDASSTTESLHLYVDPDRSFIATSPRFERSVSVLGFERYALGSGHDVVEYYLDDRPVQIDTGAGHDALYMLGTGHRISTGTEDDYLMIAPEGPLGDDLFLDGGEGGETETGDTLEFASNDLLLDVVIDGSGSGTITDGTGVARFENFERFVIGGVGTRVDASAADFDLALRTYDSDTLVISGSGNDTLGGDSVFGGAGDDLISAGAYADGGEGDDVASADEAHGGAGNDSLTGFTLFGDDGDDTLDGDTMTGGEGTDSFIARGLVLDGAASGDVEVVTDLEPGETVTLTVSYNVSNAEDPSILYDPPEIVIEEDPVANEVRVLANGVPVLVMQNVSALPEGALDLTVTGFVPDPY